jgi:hypothetical protein
MTMNEPNEFKRLNFFTGLFTTAQDWSDEQAYHQKKLALHNRWLHNPGVVRSERDELGVEAAGSLQVRVLPGAALDGDGHEFSLSEPRVLNISDELDLSQDDAARLVYIIIEYDEAKTDYVENVQQPQYSGHTRITERPRLKATLERPDNQAQLELARIDLSPGVTEILEPEDPDNPKANEIDRRYVLWAGPLDVAAVLVSPETLEHLIQVMSRTRRDFAALDDRFPTASVNDARHAALTVEMLARTGCVHAEHLPRLMAVVAAIEQDAGQEMKAAYGNVLDTKAEFHAYLTAVQDLWSALRPGEDEAHILNAQDAVAEAARELSELVAETPIADAGPDRTIITREDEASVTLNADHSWARGGRAITSYRWELAG